MRRLLLYMAPYKPAIAASLMFLGVNAVLQVAGPLLMKMAIDRYLAPAKQQIETPLDAYLSADPWVGLGQISLIYLAVVIINLAILHMRQWYLHGPFKAIVTIE